MGRIRAFIRAGLTVIACLVIGAAIVQANAPSSKHDALDGMQFKGRTGEKGKDGHHDDTISFRGGVFRSLDCEAWGFGPASYTVFQYGDAYHFRAVLKSPDRGRLEWTGTVTGDSAEATFRWVHERWYWNIDRQYWFTGSRVTDD